MLDSIRQGISSWFIKILLGLLILSFAVWGVGDIFIGGGANPTVATVGDRDITADRFIRAYQRDLNRLSQQEGRQITPNEGRERNLTLRTLSQLVGQTMFSETVGDYGLSISDDLLRDAVWSNEAFQDVTGRFNRNLFLQTLGQNGLSEEEYIAAMRSDLARDQLLSSITVGAFAPAPLVRPIFEHRQEERRIQLAVLRLSDVADPPVPDEPTLARFHEENEARYIAPEYRGVTYVWIAPDALYDEIEVTDDEVRRIYEQRTNDYFTAERRTVEQLIFDREDEARAARDRVLAGESFEAVAADAGAFNAGATSLGTVEWLDLPEDLGDAVFDLPPNTVSGPIETSFGFHIARVTEVISEGTKPIEEVRDDIVDEIRRQRAFDGLEDLVARLEDEMAGGRTLEDAALRVRLTSTNIAAVDRTGRDRNGRPIDGIPDMERFIDAVFRSDTGLVSEPQSTSDGGFFVARIDNIAPESVRPLDEIRATVVRDWTQQRKLETAQETAEALLASVRAGRALGEAAAEYGADLVASPPITRTSGQVQPEISRELVTRVFALRPGEYASAATADGEGYAVARLDEVIPATPATNEVALGQLRDILNTSMAQDILEQYQRALEQDVGVQVNHTLLNSLDLNALPGQGGGHRPMGHTGF